MEISKYSYLNLTNLTYEYLKDSGEDSPTLSSKYSNTNAPDFSFDQSVIRWICRDDKEKWFSMNKIFDGSVSLAFTKVSLGFEVRLLGCFLLFYHKDLGWAVMWSQALEKLVVVRRIRVQNQTSRKAFHPLSHRNRAEQVCKLFLWTQTSESTKHWIFFDIRFSTLIHWSKTKRRKPNFEMGKLGCFWLG